MKDMRDTGHFSWNIGELSEGCKACVRGEKLVLFLTGACPRNCWYCPVSDEKMQKDVIYANEDSVTSIQEIIREAKLCQSKGAGITGGDPLTKIERCVDFIKDLKKEFGKQFHIHLYTSLILVTEEKLKKLYESGLDEIRFHPDFKNTTNWNKIELARKFDWKIGIEIPCIPDFKSETFALLNFFKDNVDFINLNELEAADSARNKVFDRGYKSRDTYSYGILGSEELTFEIMNFYKKEKINIHFCTSKLKNIEQLGNRIKLRAKNIKKPYDKLTSSGSLIRGVIFTEKPSFNYHKELKKKDKDCEFVKLKKLKEEISEKIHISSEEIDIDLIKYRLLTSQVLVKKYKNELKKIGLVPAIIEELATGDLFEIETTFL